MGCPKAAKQSRRGLWLSPSDCTEQSFVNVTLFYTFILLIIWQKDSSHLRPCIFISWVSTLQFPCHIKQFPKRLDVDQADTGQLSSALISVDIGTIARGLAIMMSISNIHSSGVCRVLNQPRLKPSHALAQRCAVHFCPSHKKY